MYKWLGFNERQKSRTQYFQTLKLKIKILKNVFVMQSWVSAPLRVKIVIVWVIAVLIVTEVLYKSTHVCYSSL